MKTKHSITLLLAFILVPMLTFGQTRRAYEKAAAKYMKAKDYFEAMRNYQKAVSTDSTKLSNIIGAADAARKFTAFAIAEKYYQLAVDLDSTAQSEALFWLAYVENSQGKYDEAEMHYRKWLTKRTPADSLYSIASMYLDHNQWAKANPNFQESIKVTNLGDKINSPASDFGYARDGDKLYYSSLRFLFEKDKENPKRYFSKLMVAEGDGEGVKLEAPFNLNPGVHVGNFALNKDATVAYFTICNSEKSGNIKCQIYLSEKQSDGSWGKEEKLPDEVNLPFANTTQPMVATEKGKSVLYFASDREGGKGKMDIWRAEMTGKNSFGKVENLSSVNTPMNEVTPFYHVPTHTLYFSSDGYAGYGLFDVFKSVEKKGNWSEVQNMQKPTNTSYNDTYYVLTEDGRKGWLASNRPTSAMIDDETGTCCNDIYELDIPVAVKLIVNTLNKLSNDVLNGVTVQLINLTDGTIDTAELLVDGSRYFFPLELGKEYKVVGLKDEYVGDTVLVSTLNAKQSDVIEKDLLLSPKLELLALTFDKITVTPLPKAGVRLIDLSDNSKEQIVNDMSNKFEFAIDYGKDYMLIGYREDFSTDTVRFTTKGLPFVSKKIEKKLYLEKDEGIYATLPVYFHNDEPNPRTTSEVATTSYEQSYRRYIGMKDEYMSIYASGFPLDKQEAAKKEVARFFDQEVTRGYESLQRFAKRLKKYMARDKDVKIVIKGFASPLAPANYNVSLTKRRIDNVERFLKEQDNGYLRSYFNSGRIKVVIEPYGESKAAADVSDSAIDRHDSVYNPKAARERRVEILQLKSSPKKTL